MAMMRYLDDYCKIFRNALLHENGRPVIHNVLRPYNQVKEFLGSEVLKKPYLEFDWYWDLFLSQGVGELSEFLKVLEQLKKKNIGLEIGFLRGGTHLIFRDFFNKFISVEVNPESFLMYVQNNIFNEKSEFIIGPSIHPKVLDRVKELTSGSIDFIFIDGGHDYQDIKSDFLNYWPLLSMGGLIAMHDTMQPAVFPGVRKFIEELGKYLDIKHIQVDYNGISYVIKDEKNFNVKLPVNKFICSLDHIENNARICLYGAGQKGSLWQKRIIAERKDLAIVFYVDSHKEGEKDGLPVVNLRRLHEKRYEFDFILITSADCQEIEKTLMEKNIDNYFIAI